MHTADLLDEALAIAIDLGYQLRQEWLGGEGGGACEVHGQRLLFIDLAQSPAELLETVATALENDPQLAQVSMSEPLRRLLVRRKSA